MPLSLRPLLCVAIAVIATSGCRPPAPRIAPEETAPPAESQPPEDRARSVGAAAGVSTLAEPVQAEPIGLLVSVEELRQRLGQADLRIVDTRPLNAYTQGHIPGAVWVDVEDWTALGLSPGGQRDSRGWSERLGSLGISSAKNVVVYGDENITNTTRIWWTLAYVGVRHVGVLDGGWSAWLKADGPVGTEVPTVVADPYQTDFQAERLATMQDVRRLLDDPEVTIIDARSEQEYNGTRGPGPRHGRLPGAVHQEWKAFVTSDGRFQPVESIRAVLAAAGVNASRKNVVHCQAGARSSLNCFAMELAGFPPAMHYYSGWSEWSPAEEAPIETLKP